MAHCFLLNQINGEQELVQVYLYVIRAYLTYHFHLSLLQASLLQFDMPEKIPDWIKSHQLKKPFEFSIRIACQFCLWYKKCCAEATTSRFGWTIKV